MFYLRLLFTALRSLESNFLRSLLATVGVLIGVASVVACMSILEGAKNDILKRFKSLGANVVYVVPAVARVEGRSVGASQTLVPGDIDTLLRELPTDVESVAPEATGFEVVKRFQKSDNFSIVATSDEYFKINSYNAERGRIFTRQESNDSLANVILIGNKVSEKLFSGDDPTGQAVKIRGVSYRVIGVMEKKGNLGFLNADETVYLPIQAGLKRFFNRKFLSRLTIASTDPTAVSDLQKKVAGVLRVAHKIRPGQPDDFDIYNQEEALQQVNQVTMIFGIVFYSIAGISLVVGGIGIMNIMLVSVTERTREIGVRIACGARRGDILMQFLTESLIISLLGGGFGLLLGVMFADLLHKVPQGLFKTEITAVVILVALITPMVVGVASGIYPAIKASRLDPVDALRYE